jgi:hypothetical protein
MGSCRKRWRMISYSGAPRSMKMGNIASPWHHDVALRSTLPQTGDRQAGRERYDICGDLNPGEYILRFGYVRRAAGSPVAWVTRTTRRGNRGAGNHRQPVAIGRFAVALTPRQGACKLPRPKCP